MFKKIVRRATVSRASFAQDDICSPQAREIACQTIRSEPI